MSNDYFQFKQFRIAQDRCAMKVGTDGVLLGAWASAGAAGTAPLNILDIGTGTGLVALMLAQRAASRAWGSRVFSVTAVEREAAAASQARENAAASPWAAEVTVVEADARTWRPEAASAPPAAPRFDLIVCNPPFYANYLKSPDAARNAARHDDGLSLDDLCRLASNWLKPAPAALSLILPAGREQDALTAAACHGLRPVRRCRVFTSPAALSPGRVLLSFSRCPAEVAVSGLGPDLSETLHIYESGTPVCYSPEYRALVHPFYLNL